MEGVNCSDRAFGDRSSTLIVGNEKPPAVCTCKADRLTCAAVIRASQFVSNTTSRKYFVVDINPDEVHCKLQNYIYLITCTHCGIQCVDESITSLNLRMNIHRRGKSGCETFIDIIGIFSKMQQFKSKSLER